MKPKISLLFLIFLTSFSSSSSAQDSHFYAIDNYGAKGDAITVNTKSIQSAIDDAAAHGGGVVLFPSGKYVSGTLILKDFVILRIDAGSQLIGSTDMKDYPEQIGLIDMVPGVRFSAPLIYAENVQHAGIDGKGIIDGQGTRKNFAPLPNTNLRPGLIRFKNCRFMSLVDINLRNPARWTVHLRDSEDITIRGISINSTENRNNDGIDIDGSQRVNITGCNINTEDDAIVLKSYSGKTVNNIVVSNCILTSYCYGFKIGTETLGDINNVSVSNCVMYDSHGIALQSVDGADVSNINISNITMQNGTTVLELRLGGRLRSYPQVPKNRIPTKPGKMRNITISNIVADNVEENHDYIVGIPDYPIENLVLDNISISYLGGVTKIDPHKIVPLNIDNYPKWTTFDTLPSYGFFIRDVKGISLNRIHVNFKEKDLRTGIHCENVSGLDISNSAIAGDLQGEPAIRLVNTDNVSIQNCSSINSVNSLIDVKGKSSKGITLTGNKLNGKHLFQKDKDVVEGSIKAINNF
jgi:polygalacturonase